MIRMRKVIYSPSGKAKGYSDTPSYHDRMVGCICKYPDAGGNPSLCRYRNGIFSDVEIMTILNMLRIIDNPRQDIPFTGVLYSKIGGLITDDLAQIRLMDKN